MHVWFGGGYSFGVACNDDGYASQRPAIASETRLGETRARARACKARGWRAWYEIQSARVQVHAMVVATVDTGACHGPNDRVCRGSAGLAGVTRAAVATFSSVQSHKPLPYHGHCYRRHNLSHNRTRHVFGSSFVWAPVVDLLAHLG